MQEIFERVSMRSFTGTPVEESKVQLLLRAAMQAPSAGNQQPWEFVVVDHRDILDDLEKTSPYAGPLLSSPLAIVVLGNTEHLRFAQCQDQDLAAATQNILLEATSLELGSVWLAIGGFAEREQAVSKLLGLPPHVRPFAIVALGYPAVPKDAEDRFDPDRVHSNYY